jgi:hypothetical protein
MVLVIFFAWLQGMAQTAINVTGKVTDEKGAAIAGATITEKGTHNTTTTPTKLNKETRSIDRVSCFSRPATGRRYAAYKTYSKLSVT